MELIGLFHVLAWLEIIPWLVSSNRTEGPESSPASQLPTRIPAAPAPSLALSPRSPMRGQGIKLTCSAPRKSKDMWFAFFEERGGSWEQLWYQKSGTWHISTEESELRRTFACSYWVQDRSLGQSQSLLSEAVTLIVTDLLPAPVLTLMPQYSVYMLREQVILECLAPEGQQAKGYRFYKRHHRQPREELPTEGTGHLKRLIVEEGKAGTYSCAYWALQGSQEIPSNESNPLPINVIDPLPAPHLAASPEHQVYVVGEVVALSCSVLGAPAPALIQFFKNEGEHPFPPRSPSPTLWLSSVSIGDAGTYTCRYRTRVSERELTSPHSRAVSISVLVPPSAPQLSVSPSHPIYIHKESIMLTCSAPGHLKLSGVQFLKDNQYLDSRKPASTSLNHSLTVQLSPLIPSHSGAYSCGYWILESGREIPSTLSQPVRIQVLDHPRKPSVSVSPDYPAYVAGDRVTVHCSAPPGVSPTQYGLYKNRKLLGPLSENASSWQTDLNTSGTRNTTWAFSCAYRQLIQRRMVTSHTSNPVSLVVFPKPAPPSLQLIPHYPMYLTSESVTVKCIVPPGPYVAQTHTVLKDGHLRLEMIGPLLTLNITPSDRGKYSCRYSTELHGRRLHSNHSHSVPLGVTDPPPQPLLSMDPPSGAVSEGRLLNITCVAPRARDAGVRRFHFYKSGSKISPKEKSSEISLSGFMNGSVLSILRAGPDSTGEFTCGYEENMQGRWIPSPRSQAMNVTVTDWSLLITQVAVGGGAALALALMLMVCFCRRKKAGRQISKSYWKSRELRRSRIMRQSEDISGVNMALQRKTEGGWHQEASHDWGLLPKFPTEGPRPGKAVGGVALPKCQKGDEDADSGAEFELPELDPTYSLLTFSCSTFHQGKGDTPNPASTEPMYDLPPPPPSPDPSHQ